MNMYRLLGQLLILISVYFYSNWKTTKERKEFEQEKDRTTCADEIDVMELLQDLIMYCSLWTRVKAFKAIINLGDNFVKFLKHYKVSDGRVLWLIEKMDWDDGLL